MSGMTVRELREALTSLREQDAQVLAWATGVGEVAPRVIDTGEARVLAASWDHFREVYVIHMTSIKR